MATTYAVEGLSWLTRNFRGLPGRWRLVRWLDRHEWAFAGMPPKTVRFDGKLRMHVNPIDENGRRIYVNGYQPNERLTRHFVRLLRPGDCVVDVGANVGYYTMTAAKLVGQTGCVHAFEASPQIFPWLLTNARLNPQARIHVYKQAVTDQCGEIMFHTASAERTGYSSIRDLGEQAERSDVVPTISIDSIMATIPPVRLVKIDVEGAELLVLRGMLGLIERDRPYIIFEIDDEFLRELGSDARQQCGFLRDLGYELSRIGARGALTSVVDAPRDRCNILATPCAG